MSSGFPFIGLPSGPVEPFCFGACVPCDGLALLRAFLPSPALWTLTDRAWLSDAAASACLRPPRGGDPGPSDSSLEAQRARHGSCFYQTDVDHVPQLVHGTAARTDQRVTGLVIVEIFGAERCGSGSGRRRRSRSSLTNRPARVTPETRPGNVAPTRSARIMRDQAVDGLALGLHRRGARWPKSAPRSRPAFRRLVVGQRALAEARARGSARGARSRSA